MALNYGAVKKKQLLSEQEPKANPPVLREVPPLPSTGSRLRFDLEATKAYFSDYLDQIRRIKQQASRIVVIDDDSFKKPRRSHSWLTSWSSRSTRSGMSFLPRPRWSGPRLRQEPQGFLQVFTEDLSSAGSRCGHEGQSIPDATGTEKARKEKVRKMPWTNSRKRRTTKPLKRDSIP